MKKLVKFLVCAIATILVLDSAATAQTVQGNGEITPAALDRYFRFYVEDQYAKNGGFFMLLKEETSGKEIKCRFNQTFTQQTKKVTEGEFLLPAEFIDEQKNLRVVDVYLTGTTDKDIKTKRLELKVPSNKALK